MVLFYEVFINNEIGAIEII